MDAPKIIGPSTRTVTFTAKIKPKKSAISAPKSLGGGR